MAIDYIALKGETNIGYIIAPPNATDEDKKKADLVLDDVNGSPNTQLADMVDMLHDRRGQNTDIAIVIEFCPGVIELPDGTNWEISETKGNIYIYGNGVKIKGSNEEASLLNIAECWLHDIIVENAGENGDGIRADNSTLSNCSGTAEYGQGVHADNSTLSNCSGDSEYSAGIKVNNSTLSNCKGTGKNGYGIEASNSTLSACSGSSGEYGVGIYADNSTLSNCEGSGSEDGVGINANNSTLSNCSGSGGDYDSYGIYANNSTLTNCIGDGDSDYGGTGIYAIGSCVIQGCDGTQGGISVPTGFVETYPNTLALLQAFNKESIIERN